MGNSWLPEGRVYLSYFQPCRLFPTVDRAHYGHYSECFSTCILPLTDTLNCSTGIYTMACTSPLTLTTCINPLLYATIWFVHLTTLTHNMYRSTVVCHDMVCAPHRSHSQHVSIHCCMPRCGLCTSPLSLTTCIDPLLYAAIWFVHLTALTHNMYRSTVVCRDMVCAPHRSHSQHVSIHCCMPRYGLCTSPLSLTTCIDPLLYATIWFVHLTALTHNMYRSTVVCRDMVCSTIK